MNLAALSKYLRQGHTVPGPWLDEDVVGGLFVPLHTLQLANGVRGNLAEFGTTSGKTFIPLAAGLADGERALAVGIPSAEQSDADPAMAAARDVFHDNARLFLGLGLAGINTLPGDPTQLDTAFLCNFGHFRIVHICEQRTQDRARDAFRIATSVLAPGGVVIIDGYGSAVTPRIRRVIDDFCKQQPHIVRVAAFGSKGLFVSERYLRLYRPFFHDYVAVDVR